MDSSKHNRYHFVTLLFACAAPTAILLDFALAVSRGWRSEGLIEHGVLALSALVLLGTCTCLLLPRGWAALQRRHREIALLVVTSVVGLGMLEVVALRIRTAAEPRFHTRGPRITRTFKPLPGALAGIEGEGRYTTDAWGVRTPGVPRKGYASRVLCVGGSTTECVYLDDSETWPAMLMRQLNSAFGEKRVWVGSVGFSGFSTVDHLHFVRTSEVLNDFRCIVIQPGINDLFPTLEDESVTLRVRHQTNRGPQPPVWARSNLIRLYRAFRSPQPTGNGFEMNDGTEYEERRQKRRDAIIRDDAPDLTAPLLEYQERIRMIIQAARKRNIGVLFTTQPVLWQEGLSQEAQDLCWFGWLEDGSYLSIPALRRAIDQYNATVLAVCREEGVPCIDLSELNGRVEFYYDDCHFNASGAQAVGQLMGETLATSGILDGVGN